MGQRNILYTSPMISLEMDQQGGQGHLHPEPCVLYRNIASFPQPSNVHTILPPQGNRTISEHQGPLSYGINQYNGVHHNHPGGNISLSPPSNHYNMYMNPLSSTRVFPIPLSHGPPHDPLPFSSNHGIIEVDGFGGAFKRKNAEGYPGNFQYCFPSAGSSSSGAPMGARPLESDVGVMDGASFPLPEYRSIVDTVLAHNNNCMIRGNHLGQPYQMAGGTWNLAPALPYLHGSLNGGCIETANMCIQGTPFLHPPPPPPPIPQGHPSLHHIASPMHGVRGHNIDYHSQVATSSSHRFSANSTSHTGMNPFQDGGVEVGPRFVGPVPPNSLRIYRPHQRDMMVDATPRQRNLPHLRVLPEDGVAILDISGYHEVGDSIDHHRDMRLDIDHMSYEELLALGEQIGNVGTGLSEEIINRHLKTRMFLSSTSCSNLEEAERSCVICQGEYKKRESIGVLNCGHEYHVDCIKKWLLVKNSCPICKSSGLALAKMDL